VVSSDAVTIVISSIFKSTELNHGLMRILWRLDSTTVWGVSSRHCLGIKAVALRVGFLLNWN
jgi:hypothetical protein